MKFVERKGDEIFILLNNDEIIMLIAGLRETIEELDEWEFETRTGFQRSEMREFLDEFNKQYHSISTRPDEGEIPHPG